MRGGLLILIAALAAPAFAGPGAVGIKNRPKETTAAERAAEIQSTVRRETEREEVERYGISVPPVGPATGVKQARSKISTHDRKERIRHIDGYEHVDAGGGVQAAAAAMSALEAPENGPIDPLERQARRIDPRARPPKNKRERMLAEAAAEHEERMAPVREARNLLLTERFKQAADKAREALLADPENQALRRIEVAAHNRAGDYRQAALRAADALRADPYDGAVYEEMAWSALNQGRLDAALDAADRATELSPRSARARVIRALIQQQRGDAAAMKTDLARAGELSRKFRRHAELAAQGAKLFDPAAQDNWRLLTGSHFTPAQPPRQWPRYTLIGVASLLLSVLLLRPRRRAPKAIIVPDRAPAPRLAPGRVAGGRAQPFREPTHPPR